MASRPMWTSIRIATRRLGRVAALKALRIYWWLFRPRTRGVKVIIQQGDDVLLVRHAYRDGRVWTLPGGRVRRHESFTHAAQREAFEELGLRLPDLAATVTYHTNREHKRDTVTCFLARVETDSQLLLDQAEIAEAKWWGLERLPDSLDDGARRMLDDEHLDDLRPARLA